MAWLIIALAVTWLLVFTVVPPAIGHAFNLGRTEGQQEGYRQGRKDERNGVPVAVFVPLPPRKERRHG